MDGDEYSKELEILTNQTIKKVGEDYENLKFNTAIAQLMTLSNEMRALGKITKKDFKTYITLLNPVAPHLTEELWEMAGFDGRLSQTSWPSFDKNKLSLDEIDLPVQVNGKMRGKIKISKTASQEEALALANLDNNVNTYIKDKELRKVIYVPGKILNIVV